MPGQSPQDKQAHLKVMLRGVVRSTKENDPTVTQTSTALLGLVNEVDLKAIAKELETDGIFMEDPDKSSTEYSNMGTINLYFGNKTSIAKAKKEGVVFIVE